MVGRWMVGREEGRKSRIPLIWQPWEGTGAGLSDSTYCTKFLHVIF